jgi:hypothetical protein
MMMKSQLERLHKNELQSLHINRRLLRAIAEDMVENKENYHYQHYHQHQQHVYDQGQDEEESSRVSTTPPVALSSTSALLDILCSTMDASSSTLQEVWINDDMIQFCAKSNVVDDDDDFYNETRGSDQEDKQEYSSSGKAVCNCRRRRRLLHTLTTLPSLQRLRFYLSSTMTKTQSEDFMQLVAPTIRACTMLQSLHFCMSNSSRPAPAAPTNEHFEDNDTTTTMIAPSSAIISVGFCLTPTALYTLASVGLENHPSLSEFGLQDVVIVGNRKPTTFVTTSNTSSVSAASLLQFPLDPVLLALASLPQLETVDISLSKPVPIFQPRHGLHRPQASRAKPVVVGASASRRCYFSGRALGVFFQKARRLQDCTLWDVGLEDEHFLSSPHQQNHCLLLSALQFHPRLQFLSLRGNPGLTRNGWWKFYKMLLHGNYTLKSLFHDGGFGEDVEQAMDHVLYWNLLGRGRLFSSSSPSSSGLSDSASSLALSSLSSKASSYTHTIATSSQKMEPHDSILSDWIDMLESVNDDVTSLYYFLRQGNALLMPSSSSSSFR